jgi:predicted PurR-regulated permease PerM
VKIPRHRPGNTGSTGAPTGSTPAVARRATKADDENEAQPLKPGRERVAHLWSDGLGTVGTRALQIILVVILIAGICIAVSTLSVVMIPLMLDIILASALWPLVRALRRKLSPLLTAWTVLLGAFVVLGGIITGIVATIVHEWDGLVDKAVEGFEQLRDWAEHLPFTISQDQIDELLSKAGKVLTSSQFSASALSGISAAGEFFTGLVLTLVVLFFFLKDGDKIWQFFISWVPERHRSTWQRAGSRARDSFGGYARGTTIVAAVDAIGIGLVMAFCGVPLAFPLAMLVFLGAYIPMVGATVAGILSVLVTLVSNGLWPALIVLIGTVVVQQLEGHLLQPVVMGSTLHLHGLVILLGLAGGTVLGGIVGALISVPLIAAAWAMVKVVSGREGSLDDPEARKRHKRVRKQAKRRLKQAKSA